jgi:mono/diheme cytochrome c family protein
LVGILALAAALPAPAPTVCAQTPQSVARGREIAERACSGCHAIGSAKGAQVLAPDVPAFRAIARKPDQTAGRLEAFIMVPHKSMPAVALELGEVRDVVAYILSLR